MNIPIANKFQALIWNEAIDAACEAVRRSRTAWRSERETALTEVILGRLYLLKRHSDGT